MSRSVPATAGSSNRSVRWLRAQRFSAWSPRSTESLPTGSAQLIALADLLGPDSEVVPVSAKSGKQLDVLADLLVSLVEPGPAFYPDGELTDEPEQVLMAEFIREAALEGCVMNCRTRWPW